MLILPRIDGAVHYAILTLLFGSGVICLQIGKVSLTVTETCSLVHRYGILTFCFAWRGSGDKRDSGDSESREGRL